MVSPRTPPIPAPMAQSSSPSSPVLWPSPELPEDDDDDEHPRSAPSNTPGSIPSEPMYAPPTVGKHRPSYVLLVVPTSHTAIPTAAGISTLTPRPVYPSTGEPSRSAR